MNAYNFSGSDGGGDMPSLETANIGYTDGVSPVPPRIPTVKPTEKIKGFTYGYMANRGEIRSPRGIKSQDLLYELGNNWVCLAVANYQKAFYSTEIKWDFTRTPTDRDIAFFVEKAHSKAVKVCLKPMLNSDDNMWRAHIGFPDLNMDEMDGYWQKWFKSYTDYMLHYAELAEELGCEMLCIGCEMIATEHKTDYWLDLIGKIRNVYHGKLVYNTNHSREDAVSWFDVLDFLGTSAYYTIGECGSDKATMTAAWENVRKRMNGISDKVRKNYIFMEIGCRSAEGCSAMPWDFSRTDLPWNEVEQANFYESCLDVFMGEERFAGVFWWDWSTFIYNTAEEAKADTGFNIHLKKAEKVVREKYAET